MYTSTYDAHVTAFCNFALTGEMDTLGVHTPRNTDNTDYLVKLETDSSVKKLVFAVPPNQDTQSRLLSG
jgi:hypothetical protein